MKVLYSCSHAVFQEGLAWRCHPCVAKTFYLIEVNGENRVLAACPPEKYHQLVIYMNMSAIYSRKKIRDGKVLEGVKFNPITNDVKVQVYKLILL